MSIFLVLDLLLVLLVVLFMPIGYWRGPVKELFVTLGVVSGVVLSDYWARPWGRDLSSQTALTADGGAFIVAMAFLIAATFILGYGIGATLAPGYPSLYARALGAAVAALNGMLLLSYALQYVRLFLLSDSNEASLADSLVARFLLNDIGWVLLVAVLVAAPLLLYALISGHRAYATAPEPYDDDEDHDEVAPMIAHPDARGQRASAATQTLPPRTPNRPPESPDRAYKAEPAPRRSRPSEATRPLQVAEPRATAEPAASDATTRMGDTDPHIVIPGARTVRARAEPVSPPDTDPPPAPARSDMAPGYARCRNCHAVLAPGTTICPNCGTLR